MISREVVEVQVFLNMKNILSFKSFYFREQKKIKKDFGLNYRKDNNIFIFHKVESRVAPKSGSKRL